MKKIIPKKINYFAISFSDYSIRVTQANQKGGLKYYLEKKLAPGIIERGEIKKKAELQQAFKEILGGKKIKSRFVVVGLPEVKAFTHSFTLPPLTNEELNDAASWESEPLLPFPLEQAYLDWMILEKDKEKIRILVVALPKQLVEDYAELLESFGYQPVAFEITSLSLARLVRKEITAVIVAEIKEKEAVLVIVGPQGGIEVSSTLFFTGEMEAAQEISQTIKNLLDFYRKKIGEEKDGRRITKILFCGEMAKVELIKKIEKEVGISSFQLGFKDLKLACLVSLAQKQVAAPVDEKTINLIPPRIQGIYDRASKIKEVNFWLKICLLVLLIIFSGYGIGAARSYFDLKKIEGEIIEFQAGITAEDLQMENRAKLLNQRSSEILSLTGYQDELLSLIGLISQTAPKEIIIKHLFFDGDKSEILIDGEAALRNDLLSFREALEKTNKFSQIHIPLSSLEKEANVEFTISLTGKKES